MPTPGERRGLNQPVEGDEEWYSESRGESIPVWQMHEEHLRNALRIAIRRWRLVGDVAGVVEQIERQQARDGNYRTAVVVSVISVEKKGD